MFFKTSLFFRYFLDKDVLMRVPMMMKVVTVSFFILQILGISLTSDPIKQDFDDLQIIFKDRLPDESECNVKSYNVR